MPSGFNSIKVKPTITASLQHTAAFSADDVLFDWTQFTVPRMPGRLIGTTVLVRGTNGARQEQPFDLYFSESDDFSIGTINSGVSMQPNNDILGSIAVLASHYTDGLNTMEIANIPSTARLTMTGKRNPEDFEGDSSAKKTGSKVLYVAGVAQGALDFRSTVKTTGAHSAAASNDITVGTTSALTNFAPGDVLHAHDDANVGTVGSIPDATSIILAGNTTNAAALGSGDDLYNLNPITIIMSFTYEH